MLSIILLALTDSVAARMRAGRAKAFCVAVTIRSNDSKTDPIRCYRRQYDNSSQFFRDYYGSDCGKLVRAIREYKRIKGSHRKDE